MAPASDRHSSLEVRTIIRLGSYVEASVLPRDGGGSRVHVEWNREGSSLVGKIAVKLIVLSGGKPVAASIKKAFAKLEQEAP